MIETVLALEIDRSSLQDICVMKITGLDEARAAKKRAKAIFATKPSVVGIGITRIGDRYGVKVNLDFPPPPMPTSPRQSTASLSASKSSDRLESVDRERGCAS